MTTTTKMKMSRLHLTVINRPILVEIKSIKNVEKNLCLLMKKSIVDIKKIKKVVVEDLGQDRDQDNVKENVIDQATSVKIGQENAIEKDLEKTDDVIEVDQDRDQGIVRIDISIGTEVDHEIR
jgi:hypothetical protein